MGENPEDGGYIAGVSCVKCNSPFFSGVTPQYVMASVSGVQKCPLAPGGIDAPNGSWLLTQDGVDPCLWIGSGPTFVITFSLTAVPFVFIQDVAGPAKNWFLGFSASSCDDTFTNVLVGCPAADWGFDGDCKITWGPSIHPQ